MLQTIESHGKAGCGIISLANETNINQSELREFLRVNKDMVSKSSLNGAYKINRFGEHRGSIESMLSALVKKIEDQTVLSVLYYCVYRFHIGLNARAHWLRPVPQGRNGIHSK